MRGALRGVEPGLLGDQVAQIGGDQLAQAASLEPLEVEEVVEERGEPQALLMHGVEVLAALVLREVAGDEQLGEPKDRGERRAELVRHRCHQIVLGAFGLALLGDVAHHDDPAERLVPGPITGAT